MEWEIFTVIIAIVGAAITVTTPVLKLTSTITKLNETCESLQAKFSKFEDNNKESHRRIWEHNTKQDEKLNDHEIRIHTLEEEGKKHD